MTIFCFFTKRYLYILHYVKSKLPNNQKESNIKNLNYNKTSTRRTYQKSVYHIKYLLTKVFVVKNIFRYSIKP